MHVHFVLNFPFFSFFRKLKNVLLLWGLCGRFTKVLIHVHTRDNATIRGESNHNQMESWFFWQIQNINFETYIYDFHLICNFIMHTHSYHWFTLISFTFAAACTGPRMQASWVLGPHWAGPSCAAGGCSPQLRLPTAPLATSTPCRHSHSWTCSRQQQTAAAIDSPTRPTSVTQDICLPHTQQRS